MAMTRADRIALTGAGLLAVAMPVGLLWPRATGQAAVAAAAEPLSQPVAPPLSAALARPLFVARSGEADAPLAADAPQLAGIAGRIGRDAVALVRGADGRSRTLAPGEAVDGWTLESLAIDAAFFTRGNRRLRVPLSAGQ